nr:hypothetical protein CKG001_23620 [Bdellovibrio sp. CKG001]
MTSKKDVRATFLLSLLERAGSTGTSITEIHTAMLDRFQITRKTIARDIADLSRIYPILESEGFPARFSLPSDYKRTHQLILSEQDIQIVLLSLSALRSNSPDGLGHLAGEAEEHLISALPPSLREVAYKQRDIQKTHRTLEGRSIGADINTTSRILESLRHQKCLRLEYSSPYKLSTKNLRTFSPIIFEMTGGTPYLIAQDLSDNKKIKKLRLNRIKNLQIIDKEATPIDPKRYAKEAKSIGGVTVKNEDLVKVELVGDEYLATYFQEYQISLNQEITTERVGVFRITFEAPIQPTTIRLLLSLSPHITSIKPNSLQRDILHQTKVSYENLRKKIKVF